MTFVEPWPRTATTTNASRTLGNAIITSTTRMISRSAQPPAAPLTRPRTSPPASAITTAPRPVTRERRAPVITRLSTSRPYWSVPKGWAVLGGESASSRFIFTGSMRVTAEPATASATTSARMAAPSTTAVRRESRRTAAVMPRRPGGGCGDQSRSTRRPQQVDEDVAERADEDDTLDERVVLIEDGGDGKAAHTPARKDGLDDDGARQQVAELHADDGHDRDERVAEGVLEDDGPLRQPLGARGADVRVPEDLEEARANQAGDDGRVVQPDRGRGVDQAAPAALARSRQPAELEREDEDEEQAEPEARHRDAAERDEHRQPIEPGVRAERGQDAEDEAKRDRDGDRRGGQLQRARELVGDLLDHGALAENGLPEVAHDGAAQEARVLHGDGVVAAEL